MVAALFAISAVLVLGTLAMVLALRARVVAPSPIAAPPGLTQVRTEAAAIVAAARTEALAIREAATDEVGVRSAALEARESALAERERTWRDRRAIFDEHRFAHRKRREEIEARAAEVEKARADVRRTIDPGTVWTRFVGGPTETVRGYRRAVDRLRQVGFRAEIMSELESIVTALEAASRDQPVAP